MRPVDAKPSQADVLAWAAARGYDVTPQGRAFKALEELGEVAEAIIKIPEGRKTPADLRMETAQLALCVMGIAEAAGFDLDEEIRAEWLRANQRLLAEAAPTCHATIHQHERELSHTPVLAAQDVRLDGPIPPESRR